MFTVAVGNFITGYGVQPGSGLFNGFGVADKLVKNILQYVFCIFSTGHPLFNKTQQFFTHLPDGMGDISVAISSHWYCYGHCIFHVYVWRRLTLNNVLKN